MVHDFNTGKDTTFAGLLPTPLAVDIQHKRRTEELMATGTDKFHSRANGESRPNGLMDYLQFNGLLPTPTAIEGTKYTNTYNENSQMGQSLSAMAGSGMLPTPTAQDFKRRGPNSKQQGIGEVVRKMLPTPTARDEKNPSSPEGERIARKMEQGWTIELNDLAGMGMLPTPRSNNMTELNLANEKVADEKHGRLEGVLASRLQNSSPKTAGGTFRLSPLFTQEMMGFPYLWTELPFLSISGEQNPLKPTETP